MKTCKNCIFWERYKEAGDIESRGEHAGICNSAKFIDANDSCEKVPKDGLRYWDYEGYSAGFETGENFGCIHWKGK